MAVAKVTLNGTTLMDVTDATASAGEILQTYTAYIATGSKATGTATSGSSATQHVIHLEFSDSTDTDIDVFYDDSLLSTMITSYIPETYGQKTVDSAALDNVIWYTRPTETWETVYNANTNLISDTPYPYWWIGELANVYLTVGSVWRVTIDNGTAYRLTATDQGAYGAMIGNPLYSGGQDDGSGIPFNFFNAGWGAWSGGADTTYAIGGHTVKIERLVTS